MSQFLDTAGLEVLWELIKAQTKAPANVKTTEEWELPANQGYIPAKGEVIIYSDYGQKTNPDGTITEIPNIKIGNGTSSVADLAFVQSDVAAKVQHTLTIGDIVYDGSEDKSVPVYKGENSKIL